MKNACILSIGTEIMKGKIENTNTSTISRWLARLGIITKFHISVLDENNDIKKVLDDTKECDMFIITGGLGPTDDDLTREAVSEYLGKKLIFSDEAWIDVQNFFKGRINTIYESNKKQAMLIESGEHIKNKKGTAPGIFVKSADKLFFLLPGPPNENFPMLDAYVYPKLLDNNFLSGKVFSKEIRLFNAGESMIADLFKDLKSDCEIGYYFSQEGYLEIIVVKRGFDEDKIINDVNSFFNIIKKILSDNNIFFTDNIDIGETLLKRLIEKKLSISFAESITGGNAAASIVKIPDASKVLAGSIVAYSNEMKEKILGVKNQTLLNFGAVSSECVKEMAYGLRKITASDICVSISGIAGPTGGTSEKPAGLVYFGFLINDNYFSMKENFFGTRMRNIYRSTNFAFVEILKAIDKI